MVESVLDILTRGMSVLFGLAIVYGILAFIYRRHAEEWQRLARVYSGVKQTPQAVKRFGQMVLYADGAPARTYKGVVSIEIHFDGFALMPMQWLIPFHDPVFIPYRDIKGWTQDWYIDGKSVELEFSQAPGLRIIMPKSQLDWIKQTSGRSLSMSSERPPNGRGPWASRGLALMSGAMGLSLIVVMVLKHQGLLFT